MANDKKKASPIPRMPSLNFGGGRPSIFSGGKAQHGKSFVPPTFRITQHKGGGGK